VGSTGAWRSHSRRAYFANEQPGSRFEGKSSAPIWTSPHARRGFRSAAVLYRPLDIDRILFRHPIRHRRRATNDGLGRRESWSQTLLVFAATTVEFVCSMLLLTACIPSGASPCNSFLKPPRSSDHGRLVRSTHRHSRIFRNHNFCLRTACHRAGADGIRNASQDHF